MYRNFIPYGTYTIENKYLNGQLDFDPLAVGLRPQEIGIDKLHLAQVLQFLKAESHQLSKSKVNKLI
jgi:hypothetical protein